MIYRDIEDTTILEFASWSEMLTFADGSVSHHLQRQSRMEGSRRWSGTDSYKEAMELALYGWPDGLLSVERAFNSIKLAKSNTDAEKTLSYDVVGDILDLGEYLRGAPEHMIRQSEDVYLKRRGKVYDIILSSSYNWEVTEEMLLNRSGACLYLVDSLEASGVSVAISMSAAARSTPLGGPKAVIIVPVKVPSSVFDRDRFVFTCAHPAFLRRLMFSVWEGFPPEIVEEIGFYYGGGYGFPYEASVECDLYLGAESLLMYFQNPEAARDWADSVLDSLRVEDQV